MDGRDVHVGPFHIDLKTVTHKSEAKGSGETAAPIGKGSTISLREEGLSPGRA